MNKKEPNAFAVYPDAVKMDLATKNSLSAIFAYEHIAKLFAHELWPNTNIVTPIYSTHFDPDFKEPEFTAGQEVEVSNDGRNWFDRFYVGKSISGLFVMEDKGTNLPTYHKFCRPIKEQVTYYVYRDSNNNNLFTSLVEPDVQKCVFYELELIHSFTI